MEEFYTVNQAAILLKVHPLTVRRYIKSGSLKAYRAGGNVRIDLQDIRAFMQGFTTHVKSPKNLTSINTTKPFSLNDPLFRMRARGLSLTRLEQE